MILLPLSLSLCCFPIASLSFSFSHYNQGRKPTDNCYKIKHDMNYDDW